MAGLGARLAARIVDGLVVTVIYGTLWVVLMIATYVVGLVSSTLASILSTIGALVIFAVILGFAAYTVIATGRHGQAVGKLVLGVRVVHVQTGAPPGIGNAFLHEFVLGLMGMPCYLGYISFFTDSTGRHRALHDLAAKDVVIQVPAVPLSQALRTIPDVLRGK